MPKTTIVSDPRRADHARLKAEVVATLRGKAQEYARIAAVHPGTASLSLLLAYRDAYNDTADIVEDGPVIPVLYEVDR